MPLPQQQDDPLAAYRASKQRQQVDPLAAYRAARKHRARPDTGDITLGPVLEPDEPKQAKPEKKGRTSSRGLLDPAHDIAEKGADYVGEELSRGGAALAQQVRDIRDDVKLHGPVKAAGHVASGLAHGVIDPMLTFGSLLASPEDEMAGVPQSERKTGLQAYNRETERLAQLAAHNVRNNTPGAHQDEAAEAAAQEVRARRKHDAIVSGIATAANFAAPGVFKAAEKVAAPIATRAFGKLLSEAGSEAAGKTAGRVAGEATAGAAANAGADPTHPISAGLVGGAAGTVLGEAGHVVGKGLGAAGRGAAAGARQVGRAVDAAKPKFADVLSKNEPPATQERRAESRPNPSELTPEARAAYRERLLSEQQRLDAYAKAEPDPKVEAAYRARHARLGKEIADIDALGPSEPRRTSVEPTSGQVTIRRVPVSEINSDPNRFQFKRGADADTGAGAELKGLSKFDEHLAGVISVWRDPANGKLYAVNGHNRLALAKRTGHQSVNVQEINAATAGEARAQGALANIAEGRGTATDAANFFRETGLSTDALRDRVSFKGVIAKRGMAMSKLAPDIFAKVESGKLPEGTAAAIGEVLPDSPEMQRTAVGALERSRARLSEAEARELARQIRDAGAERTTQENLFGTEDSELPLWIEQSKLTVAIQKKLAQDRRLFGYVSKEGRAEGLARGGNVIDVERSQQIANESAQLEELFNTLSGRSGPLAEMLRQATRRIVNGEKQADIINELYPGIKEAVSQALTGSPAPNGGAPGVGNQDGQSETGYDATGRQAGRVEEGAEEGHALDSTDPNQSALLSPEHFNPGELREPRSPYEHALDALWREQGRNGRAALLKRWSELYPEQKWLSGWADLNIEDLPRHVREQIGMERVRQGIALEDVLRPKKGDEGVNYSPTETARNAEPERLVTFAFRTEDGKVIEGRSHNDAMMRALRAGYDYDHRIAGFVTSTGRFVPEGREAVMLAYEAGQLRQNTALYRALAEGAIPFDLPNGIDRKVRGVGGKNAEVPPAPDQLIAARIGAEGVTRNPDTTEGRALYLRHRAREAGLAPDYHNPEGGPVIRSRALRWRDETIPVEQFSDGDGWEGPDGQPIHAIEGYTLSDGSFITRGEAKEMFPDAEFGPEGRDKSGALFSPEDSGQGDLVGDDPLAAYRHSKQESLFEGNEGTAASRNLSQAERHAQSEVTRLRQVLGLETDPKRRAALAAEIVQHEKLLNRGKAITSDELRARAIAGTDEPGAPPQGPDQGVLLSPASQLTKMGDRLRRAVGVKNSNVGDVVALRKISVALADAVGVPLREGRGNLKRVRAEGAFWTKEEVIRVRRLKKLDTVAHEIGHYLSKKYDIKFAAKMLPAPDRMAVARELIKMGKDLYGNRKPNSGYGEEGVAQWVRFFVTEPARMVQDAPTFTSYMDKLLDRETALRDSLLKARDDWELYQASSDDAKIGSMVERSLPSRFAGTSPGQLIDYLFNDLKAIRRAVDRMGGAVKMSENAANLAELTKGNAGRVVDMLNNGVIRFNSEGVRVTRGLRQILADVGEKNREEFTNYLIARQVLTKTAQGIDTGFDVQAAKSLAAKHASNQVFVKAANEFWGFRNALLEYEADAGLLTKTEVQAIRKNNPTPTPFYRSFEEEAGIGGNGRSVQLARNSSGVHKMKGSDRPVIDPLQSIINDAYTMVDRAQKHYAATVLLKSALALDGGGHIAQLLPEVPKELRRIHMDRVAQQLVDAGWTPPDPNNPAGPGMALDYLQAFYEKRQAGAREFRDQVLPILIDGERKWVQINDRSTWEALQGMNVPELGLLERIVSSPTRWLRLGATAANPDFALLNPLRDAFPAAIYSAGPTHLPGYHVMRGAGHMLREAFHYKGGDPLTERFAQEGGESAGMVGADRRTMTRDFQRNVHEMMRSAPQAVKDHLWPPSQWVKSIAETFQIFENATRMGEFVTVREARMKAGMSEREASVEGAYSARNVTQDFQKQGRTIRWLNRYIPFLGAAMGDWYKLGMEFNPKNLETAEGRARYAKVGLRAMAYITVPSVALYLLQHDDEDYQEIPEYLKANAWVVVDKQNGPIPFTLQSGKKVRIWVLPRPYMLGYIFGYTPEKILAGIKEHDPEQFKEILKQSANILVPPWMPTIAAPFIENARNKSQFSGNPIVPESVRGLEPSEQATPRTGETARLLGRATNQSPAQIENVERGFFGGAGQTVIRGIDALAKRVEESAGKTPLSPNATSVDSDPLDHAPVVGRFIAPQPGANAKSVSRLFDDYEEAERKRQTWRSFLKKGSTGVAAAYLKKNRDAIVSVASEEETGTEQGGPLREAHKLLTDITTARRQLAAASGISPAQKAAKLKELGMLERTVAHNYYRQRSR